MKKILSAALLVTMMSQVSFASEGGREGGGGGGFCINGKCRTLAEAGIRIKGDTVTEGRWFITPAVMKEIEKIKKALPFGQHQVEAMTIGDYTTFVKAEEVSKKLMKEVKKDYRNLLEETGNTSMSRNLEIFAISTDKSTYLLPKFFRLDDRQKALILVHEGIVRTQNQDYRLALQFDGEFLDYLKQGEIPNYSPLAFLRVLSRITNDQSSQTPYVVKYIESKLGRKMAVSDFHDDKYFYQGSALKEVGAKALLKNQGIISDYLDAFGEASYSEVTNAGEYLSKNFTRDEMVDACGENGTETVRMGNSATGKLTFLNCDSLGNAEIYGVAIIFKGLNKTVVRK